MEFVRKTKGSTMALARFALKSIQRRVMPSFSSSYGSSHILSGQKNHTLGSDDQRMRMRWFSTDEKPQSSDITVNQAQREGEGGRKKSKWFPWSKRENGGGVWRHNNYRDVAPFDLQYLFPSGLGNALMQASENFNKLMENLSPSGWVKEQADGYKLKYEVPGLAKEDVKITVADGVLTIQGERKEDAEDNSDDEHWSSYGYYNATLLLPDDAKVDEVKAQLKDGVLTVIIPKTEKPVKDVKEVQIE